MTCQATTGITDNSITMRIGTTKSIPLLVTEADGTTPRVITGATITLRVKNDIDDAAVLLTLVSPTNIVIRAQVGADIGYADIKFVPAHTSSWSIDEYLYDVQLLEAGGDLFEVIPPTTLSLRPTLA